MVDADPEDGGIPWEGVETPPKEAPVPGYFAVIRPVRKSPEAGPAADLASLPGGLYTQGPSLGVARFLESLRRPRGFRAGDARSLKPIRRGSVMTWTKPEAEVVAVTMEVTAYVATL